MSSFIQQRSATTHPHMPSHTLHTPHTPLTLSSRPLTPDTHALTHSSHTLPTRPHTLFTLITHSSRPHTHTHTHTLSQPRVIAVLDWELCTIGHPLSDLSYMAVFSLLAPGKLVLSGTTGNHLVAIIIGSNCPGNSTLPYGPEVPFLSLLFVPEMKNYTVIIIFL